MRRLESSSQILNQTALPLRVSYPKALADLYEHRHEKFTLRENT